MQRTPTSVSLFLSTLLVLAGCSDAPRSESATAPAATDPHAGLPTGHPPLDPAQADTGGQVAGRAILKGALAQASSGSVFITLRIAGQRMPTWSYKVDLVPPTESKHGLGVAKDGVRELIFVLNQQTTMFPGAVDPASPYEVQVMYDPDGSVDSKDGQVTAISPAKIGADDLYLELDPASAASK